MRRIAPPSTLHTNPPMPDRSRQTLTAPDAKSPDLPWLTPGDLDGFVGLFIDNLVQLLVIVGLCSALCGIPGGVVFGTILPGAAISILVGNLFYTWQARRVARTTGDASVTALPYGINTVSLFAFVFFIMAPVYRATNDWQTAYALGLVACLFSGMIETLGAFIAEPLRRHTPRPALLATLAAIAIGFISMDFIFRIFNQPGAALLPLGIILAHYFGHLKLPGRVPGGLLALVAGTLFAWLPAWPVFDGIGFMQWDAAPRPDPQTLAAIPRMLDVLATPKAYEYFAVIIPMALFSILGSLQNIESAEAAGDRFDTRRSLLMNGLGTMVAACAGSAFPTTIYIGHPGWKAMGARQGYSALNGVVIFALCAFGGIGLVARVVPIEAGAAIVFWIALVITAQAFQACAPKHAPAVALGLIPGLVAWGVMLVEATLGATGVFTFKAVGLEAFAPTALAAIKGMLAVERGFMFTSMIWASLAVCCIDKRFGQAALWTLVAATLAFFGVIHAYTLTDVGTAYRFGINVNPTVTLGYVLMAGYFWLAKRLTTTNGG